MSEASRKDYSQQDEPFFDIIPVSEAESHVREAKKETQADVLGESGKLDIAGMINEELKGTGLEKTAMKEAHERAAAAFPEEAAQRRAVEALLNIDNDNPVLVGELLRGFQADLRAEGIEMTTEKASLLLRNKLRTLRDAYADAGNSGQKERLEDLIAGL